MPKNTQIIGKPNTLVNYVYRDASNHKYWGSFVVKGKLRLEQIEKHFFDTEFFVATEVGLKHLLTDSWNEDDHVLHSFGDFEPTNIEDTICTVEELVQRFENANIRGWFHSYDGHRQ